MPAGRTLRLETLAPAQVRWSDGWRSSPDSPTHDAGLGVRVVDARWALDERDARIVVLEAEVSALRAAQGRRG
jgi:hypothetical protein